MNLRFATMDDAQMLFEWRNDPLARQNSRNTEPVALEGHLHWLRLTLSNPDRRLYVAEVEGNPVGTVRADWDGKTWEISFTTAPEHRGKGYGKEMVKSLMDTLHEPVRAEVKEGNTPSARIVEAVGLTLDEVRDGMMHYSRKNHA